MMNKSKIAKAIAMAMTGTALSAGAISSAEAHVMYNTAIATDQAAGTDGWVWNGQGNPGYDSGTYTPWLGTAGGALPFGYSGQAALHWAAAIHGPGSLVVSEAEALAEYGQAVEIDTGAGAWQDNITPTGWKHQTDIGLIKSDFDTTIRINIARVSDPVNCATTGCLVNDNFGVTVFEGMDTTLKSTAAYSHHGGWNNNGTNPIGKDNPWYVNGTTGVSAGTGMTAIKWDDTVDMSNFIEFDVEAGKVYTIALGGNGVGRWNQNVSDYSLTITAVPVPAAVWLFGSALAGMGIIGRRKNKGALVA